MNLLDLVGTTAAATSPGLATQQAPTLEPLLTVEDVRLALLPDPPLPKGREPGCDDDLGDEQHALSILTLPTDSFVADDATALGLADALAATPHEIAVDVETTQLTPWSPPLPLGKTKKLGTGETIHRARKRGITFNPKPRLRVLSVGFLSAGAIWNKAAVDFDALGDAAKVALVRALNARVWVGQNLQFDLAWLRTIDAGVKPSRTVDTMWLATTHVPDLEYQMQQRVLRGEAGGRLSELDGMLKAELVQRQARAAARDDDTGSMPLKLLSLFYLNAPMDKAFQKPENWMMSELSAGHCEYCLGDVDAPPTIARKMLGLGLDASTTDLLAAINAAPGSAAYQTFERAALVLVNMQRTGLPWNATAASALRKKHEAALGDVRQALEAAGLPADTAGTLCDPTAGLSAATKDALADAIEAEAGVELPRTAAGGPKLDSKTLTLHAPKSTLVAAFAAAQEHGKLISMIDSYQAAADAAGDGKLHPSTTISTTTGRTRSGSPNLQNMPRAAEFRALIAAPPGHKILAADYSSIELRIAAALGVRAYRDWLAAVDCLRNPTPGRTHNIVKRLDWVLKSQPKLRAYVAAEVANEPPTLDEPAEKSDGIAQAALKAAYELRDIVASLRDADGRYIEEVDLALRAAYVAGVDPHLLTAIRVRAPEVVPAGLSALDYLKSVGEAEMYALKNRLKAERQAAKAVNFGLVYGMSAAGLHAYGVTGYGLDWTEDEAAAARLAWLASYPELSLWHYLVRRTDGCKAAVFDRYAPGGEAAKFGKVFVGETLTGRPTASSQIQAALNYQDQGTGAEIALAALSALDDYLHRMLINFVHDELVLVVPAAEAERARLEVEQTMLAAANNVLVPFGVPCAVESEVGDVWIH